ncbi:MAG: hypothetical protein AAF939_06160 [Planctomycetota bacterium]
MREAVFREVYFGVCYDMEMTENGKNDSCPAELPNYCANRHWSIFWILILCSTATLAGHLVTIKNHNARGESSFFSANDRSRWSTIRALVEDGTYVIDRVIERDQPIDWDTIDKVQHVGADGKLHFYSSKPTLLPTLLAGIYQVVYSATNMTLSDHPVVVSRIILLIFNLTIWFAFLYFLALTINAIPVRDWSRYFVLACGGFGTYLLTFSVSLNNHVPAATCVMIATYLLMQIYRQESTSTIRSMACGIFSGLAASNELPALAFLAIAGLICFFRQPQKALTGFLPGVILVGIGFFGTNYLAHQDWKPAYAHRSDGNQIATVSGDSIAAELDTGKFPNRIAEKLGTLGIRFERPAVNLGQWPTKKDESRRWVVRDEFSSQQIALVQNSAEPETIQILAWNNWYDYAGSYWLSGNDDQKSFVDRGQQSKLTYAFHLLFGHHGIFSLTPIWLLSFTGGLIWLFGRQPQSSRFSMRWFAGMTLIVSIVVIGFYINRPAIDRNYGGVCCALRWLFWLAPLWLVSMLPVVDWLGKSKLGQTFCLVLLSVSVVSAFYAIGNPWSYPWLFEIWDWTGIQK